ncbi:MAG TPA: DNA repair protein RecO [Candidatus Saccharimonadia bacterium]|nr:DNA repair protein RecO [Candidatus Saccharimonadia bacterium]
MNQQQVTIGIVLARVDYGEADRIITFLTPEAGKLRVMAKGVRRVKSKLAGGVELFSITNLTYVKGRGDIGTLVSARLVTHYGHIIQDINRTMLGYDVIKRLNKITEDEPEADYFHLLERAFMALDDLTINLELVRLWFVAQLLKLEGYQPNLQTEPDGTRLKVDRQYEFSFDDSAFVMRPDAPYDASAIKFLRLVFSGASPTALQKVAGIERLVTTTGQLITLFARQYNRE